MSIASLATRSKLIKYSDLQKELRLEGIRELEDLIIEGTNCNVMRGKLDQKSSHFEVDWAMGRDIRKVKPLNKQIQKISSKITVAPAGGNSNLRLFLF